MTHLHEKSVLQEIAYLDPELDGDAGLFQTDFRRSTSWDKIRQFICTPCAATVGAFSLLLVIGVNLQS